MASMPAQKKTRRQRVDGWTNLLTKVGDRYRDKTTAVRFERELLDEVTCEEIWLGDDIAARVIELPPKVQLQHGFKVLVSELEPRDDRPPYAERLDSDDAEALKEAQEAIETTLDELDATAVLIEALQWKRAYGGAAVLLGVDDGQRELSKPVDFARVKAVRYMVCLRPRECRPAKWNANPRSRGYGLPEVYRVQRETSGSVVGTTTFDVHASRILRFEGIRVSRRHTSLNHGWGDSVLNRLYQPLADFQQSYRAVPNLIADFAQGVHSIEGLAELIMANEDDLVRKRIETMDVARSMLRSLIIDSKDKFERLQTPVSGLAELLDRCAKRFAAAADMPVSLLMGDQPAGLNATGEQNTRWWYDSQGAEREVKLRPIINKLLRLIFISSEGPTAGVEPERWKVLFNNLWVPSQAEVAAIRAQVATADAAYVNAGVLTPEEVAISRFGGDEWSMDTRIDLEMRHLQAEQTKTAVENEEGPNSPAASAALQGQLKGPGQPGEEAPDEDRADEEEDDEDRFRVKPFGFRRTGLGITIDVESQRAGRRTDFDEDQPRDELGRFGSGGGARLRPGKKDAKAAKAEVKRGAIAAAAGKLGGDPKIATTLVNAWQEDSGSGEALALKAAIALEIGVTPEQALARAQERLANQGVKGVAANAAAAQQQVAEQIARGSETKVRATARAIAQASQSAHDSPVVTLYRGVSGAQAEQLRAALASGASSVDLHTDAIASFTEDPKVARVFGNGGFILKMDVPREAIVLSHRASSALKKFGDSEVVVATLGKFTVDRANVTEWQPERTKSWAEIQAEIAAERR